MVRYIPVININKQQTIFVNLIPGHGIKDIPNLNKISLYKDNQIHPFT